MILTKEELIKLLNDNNIEDMEVEISSTPIMSERKEWFYTDAKMEYRNDRVYSESKDLLKIQIKVIVNHSTKLIGFFR